jgi:hypothetical protein
VIAIDSIKDRLPTVSASQALQNLSARGARIVPTGLKQLDKLLAPPSLPGQDTTGGYARGKVTEVYGPSGVGKTSLLVQAATNSLHEGHHVYWIGIVGPAKLLCASLLTACRRCMCAPRSPARQRRPLCAERATVGHITRRAAKSLPPPRRANTCTRISTVRASTRFLSAAEYAAGCN